MSGSFLVNTDDIGEAEQILSSAFAALRLGAVSDGFPTRSRIWRTPIGPLVLDETEYTFDLDYHMEPPDQILLCRMRSGLLEQSTATHGTETVTAGETIALAAAEGNPAVGRVSQARYDILAFDRRLLNDVARAGNENGQESVRLTASLPVSPAANQRLIDVVDHIRFGVVANPEATTEPLVAGYLARYVAACLLSTFPTNAILEPSIEDRRDSTQMLVRRAMAFVDENAHIDISLTDIATATHVTPQAVMHMFRRHLDITPTAYVRRVRLNHAHTSLVASNPHMTTVAQVANRWGFANPRRFAFLYRRVYGRSPERTLRE